MEKQLILSISLEGRKKEPYYSKWFLGRRIPGSENPYDALKRNEEPYRFERLEETDIPLLLESLIKWSDYERS